MVTWVGPIVGNESGEVVGVLGDVVGTDAGVGVNGANDVDANVGD